MGKARLKHLLEWPRAFHGLVRVLNVFETQKLERAVLNGTQYSFECWSGHFFSNAISICLRGYNVHVDGEVGNAGHEIGHAQDAAVDAGCAFDFEHGDDCVSVKPDHVDVLDDFGDGVAESWQYEFVDTLVSQWFAVVGSVLVVDCDVDIVAVLMAQLNEEPLNLRMDTAVICAVLRVFFFGIWTRWTSSLLA